MKFNYVLYGKIWTWATCLAVVIIIIGAIIIESTKEKKLKECYRISKCYVYKIHYRQGNYELFYNFNLNWKYYQGEHSSVKKIYVGAVFFVKYYCKDPEINELLLDSVAPSQ